MIDLRISKNIFNDTYYPYLNNYEHKLEIYYGGAGSGKSVFITQKLIIKALKSTRKILVLRKTLVSQKESCWRLFLDTLQQFQILKYCNIRTSDYTIEFPNGSTILFKGLDNPERIKSIVGVTDIWLEEASEFTEEDYDQLLLRLRSNKGNLQMFLSFNPISKASFIYKRWFDKDIKVLEDTLIVKTTYKDNRFLPKAYITALENMIKTNPTYYKIYALGEFCSLDKLVYNNWKVADFDYKTIVGETAIGCDWGFTNDPTAIIASIVDQKNRKIYIFKEYYKTGLTNMQIANVIKSLGFSKSVIIADSAEPKSIEELRRMGITRIRASVKGPDSIIAGIQLLQQYEIIVHPSCENTITELENYSWQKDKQTGEYLNKPTDDFNHALDALRYSIQSVEKGKLRTFSRL